MLRPRLYCLILFPLLFLFSCGNDPFDIDLSGIEQGPVTISRFDRDLFALDTSGLPDEVEKMRKRYGAFFDGFSAQIIYNKGMGDSLYYAVLRSFLADEDMHTIFGETQKVFPDLRWLEKDIEDVFRRIRYYFPDKTIPGVTACVTGLNLPMSHSDTLIGIGLDMYLGVNSSIYEMAMLEDYRRANMHPGAILPDLIRAWGMISFERKEKKMDLLTEMIWNGKLLYLADALAPRLHDTLKIGYSMREMEWCRRNEGNIWSYLLKDNLLFTTEDGRISRLMNEGPFTPGFHKDSPSRTGRWTGWMIVRQYMQNNPGISLQQLMDEQDPQVILQGSGYKPG